MTMGLASLCNKRAVMMSLLIMQMFCAVIMLSGARGGLPLASLRLMASPLQMTYSYIWQVIRQRNVKHYGKVEEFVTMVTHTVPELLSFKQTAQLILGLRARVGLLSQFVCVDQFNVVYPRSYCIWLNRDKTNTIPLL